MYVLTSDSESREEIQVVNTNSSSEKRDVEHDISSSVNFDLYNNEDETSDVEETQSHNNDDLYAAENEKISILGHKRIKILKQRQVVRPSLPDGNNTPPEIIPPSTQQRSQSPTPPPRESLPPPLQATTSNGGEDTHHHHQHHPLPPQQTQQVKQQQQQQQQQQPFQHEHEQRHLSVIKQELPLHPVERERDREERRSDGRSDELPYYPYARMDGRMDGLLHNMSDTHRGYGSNSEKPLSGANRDMYSGLTPNYRISSSAALSPTSSHHRDPHDLKVSAYSVRRSSVSPHDASTVYENVTHHKKTFFCYLCGKEYRSGTGLKQHLLAHKNEKPFGCNICQRRYRWKGDLNRHMYTHLPNNELPLKCPECNKGFVRKDKMQLHINFAHGGPNLNPTQQVGASLLSNEDSKPKLSNNSSHENNVEMSNCGEETNKHSPVASPVAPQLSAPSVTS